MASTYLHIVRIRIVCGVEIRSLVCIFDGGIISIGQVGYGVGSALKDSRYESHIARKYVVGRYEKVGGLR